MKLMIATWKKAEIFKFSLLKDYRLVRKEEKIC